MEIRELFPDKIEKDKPKQKPKKVLILALARDSKGLEAKNYGEVMHTKLPDKFNKPLVKVFRDVDWREFQRRLRSSTKKWDYVSTCAVFIDGVLIGNDDDFKEYLKNEYSVMIEQAPLRRFSDLNLLDKIGKHPLKSYVFFDVNIHEKKAGRMIFEIDSNALPKSTKLFLQLCCHQKLMLPDDVKNRGQFHNAVIKRIVKDSWIEGHIPHKVCTGDSKHEPSSFRHDKRGILSLSYDKRERIVSSHFVITLDECHWMDQHCRPIGRLIDGENVLHMIENVKTSYERPLLSVTIGHSGILYSPTMMTTGDFEDVNLVNVSGLMKVIQESYRGAVRRRLRQKPLEMTDDKDTIEFVYSVSKEVVEERRGIQWDSEVRRSFYVTNVGVTAMPKEKPKTGLDSIVHFASETTEEKQPVKIEPFGKDTGDYDYYRFANRSLKKITPRLLLAWAQGIDSHYKIKSIVEDIEEFLDNAVKIVSGTKGDAPHPMDAPSGMMFPERYFKCLYSLPTELLALLREMVDDCFVRVESPRRALSDDVISGHLIAIVDVTRRMIESTTDIVQCMENFDLISDMIDELIIKKVEEFEARKRKWVKQAEKRFSPFVIPSAEASRDFSKSIDFGQMSIDPSSKSDFGRLASMTMQ